MTVRKKKMMESIMMAQPELGGMVVTEKVRKTREGKPKSRNGCKTCKYVGLSFLLESGSRVSQPVILSNPRLTNTDFVVSNATRPNHIA